MATASIETETKIVLNLTQEEADYLMGLTQNFIGNPPEDRRSAFVREEIFLTLKDALASL